MTSYTTYKDFEIEGFSFTNKYELQEEIEEKEQIIKSIEDRLKMWAVSDPNSIIPEKDEDGMYITDKVWYVQHMIKDELDSLKDFYIELGKLQLIEDNWDSQKNTENK